MTLLKLGKRERRLRRILVVEDDPLVAFDNEHMLGDAGYEVVATVDNLDAARAVIEAEALDLVLTDIALRGEGDGRDVARIAAARGVPALFLTAHLEIEGGAIGRLAKPYTDRQLEAALAALEKLLQGRRMKKLPAGLRLFADEAAQDGANAAST